MNPFFQYLNNLRAFARARASDIALNLQQAEVGFGMVATEFERTLKAPATEASIGRLPLREFRRGKVFVFDGITGDPAVQTIATDAQMAAAVAASQAAAVAEENVRSAAHLLAAEIVTITEAAENIVPGKHYVMAGAAATTLTVPAFVRGDAIRISPANGRRDNSVIFPAGIPINGIAGDPVYVFNMGRTTTFRHLGDVGIKEIQ